MWAARYRCGCAQVSSAGVPGRGGGDVVAARLVPPACTCPASSCSVCNMAPCVAQHFICPPYFYSRECLWCQGYAYQSAACGYAGLGHNDAGVAECTHCHDGLRWVLGAAVGGRCHGYSQRVIAGTVANPPCASSHADRHPPAAGTRQTWRSNSRVASAEPAFDVLGYCYYSAVRVLLHC